MNSKEVVVVGGGFAGIVAAHDLAKSGFKVTLLEKDEALGGLAGIFEISPGYWVEKFYHHWFASDRDIIGFLEEIGAGDEVRFAGTNTGLYFANSIFRLASPFDLLRFHPLPFLDRVRTGLMALYARRIEEWKPLEDITAIEWIKKVAGEKSFEVIWQPLLNGKFGAEAPNVSAVWFWNKLKLRGSSRNKKGAEELAYFAGSFGAAIKAMEARLRTLGVTIKTGATVSEITAQNGKVSGVVCNGETIPADMVLCTAPLPIFLKMTPALSSEYRALHEKVRFLGNVCLVLRLNRSLSSTYWLNIADPHFPFVGIIEHTNFDDPAHYGGERIAYLSKYLPTSDALYTMSDADLYEYTVPHIQRLFPEFSKEWVIGYKVWRAEYSQPVITKHYSTLIPDQKTPIEGLWLSTMAQVYPEDRGTNYAIRHGRDTARKMIESVS